MTIKKKIKLIGQYSYFIWLIFLIFSTVLVTYFYDLSKKNQINYLNRSLKNIYLNSSLKRITSELKPRYIYIEHKVKEGDTYESIINNLNIQKKEKKLFLNSVTNNKNINILKLNQKIFFKIDKKNNTKIVNFTIEIDKKKNIFFEKIDNDETFVSKIIEKTLTKTIAFQEGIIKSSLYNAALKLGIKPNTIVEFARLYGFQIDFQRDIWKNDSFQIIYEEFKNEDGSVVEVGNIIYANLNTQNTDLQLYKFEYEKNKIDYFDESGKSIRKTLMKTPINGARLSSSFGKRKHPILGFTKMHTGTDFAASKGTPIMASGHGIVVKSSWCGGGGNCVKIKHNSTYQTVYAHLSKFGRGIKKGVRVKQGQIIGYVGSTGLSTGPHLHYEVIENGRKINSQKLKLPSGKILKGNLRKKFEVNKIKIDVLKSELISKIN
ncbi:MAG TPA: peptidoglycan DD-metalloendopeptidase family protein [Candidatus Pelagibacter bacterium]|nr:peptidoglycan DD-metalloendopeptidase family protein [Candidatus Pelagibacter bacterium]